MFDLGKGNVRFTDVSVAIVGPLPIISTSLGSVKSILVGSCYLSGVRFCGLGLFVHVALARASAAAATQPNIANVARTRILGGDTTLEVTVVLYTT